MFEPQDDETVQPILILLVWRGGARFKRALDSLKHAEIYFKRVILSITSEPNSIDMQIARQYLQDCEKEGLKSKAELICTETELPTMKHQAFWLKYLLETGADPDDWIYWLAYDDELRINGLAKITDTHRSWPLRKDTIYLGPWAMRHEESQALWHGDPKKPLEVWTCTPQSHSDGVPLLQWLHSQLQQPTYIQMSGSVSLLQAHSRLVNSLPKKGIPMRIEMETALLPGTRYVKEFSEPTSIIYGRPDSDRSKYSTNARNADFFLVFSLLKFLLFSRSPSWMEKLKFCKEFLLLAERRRREGPTSEAWIQTGQVLP